jgi:hypothetical protein
MKLPAIIKLLLKVLFAILLVWSVKRILLLTGLFGKICHFFLDPPLKSEIFNLLNKHYTLWEVVLFGILFVIGYIIAAIIIGLLSGKKFKMVTKAEKKSMVIIKKNKNALIKSNSRRYGEILFRYDVGFDQNDLIYIENLTPYCLKHDNSPVRMIDNYHKQKFVCSVHDCDNHIDNPLLMLDNPMLRYSNIIVSELEKEWEELNK